MKKSLISLIVVCITLLVVIPAAAGPGNPNSLNAKFIRWQEKVSVVHIMVYENGSTATVEPEEKILFGFEWGADEGQTLEDMQEYYIDGPNHDITLSIDGGAEFSVRGSYQPPFTAATRSGPRWSWDHDGDGPYDRDGDGIGDWSGDMLFFRYQHAGFTSGTHTFTFKVYDSGSELASDTITVVIP